VKREDPAENAADAEKSVQMRVWKKSVLSKKK